MRLRLLMIVCAVSIISVFAFGQDDVSTLRSILRTSDPQKRIAELKSFLAAHPESLVRSRAWYTLFQSYLETGKTDSALMIVPTCIAMTQPPVRGQMSMQIAESLSDIPAVLGTAEAYIDTAEQWAREKKRQELPEILNVKAKILVQEGNSPRAEELEYEALQADPANAEYLLKLGLYKAQNGKTDQALRSICRSILFGYTHEALSAFDSIVAKGRSDSSARLMKEAIVGEVVRSYVDSTKPAQIIGARSVAAALMARTGVNLKRAREWAASAAKSPEKGETIEEFIDHQLNLALVSMAEKKYAEAISVLHPVAKLVDPWNDEFWSTLGRAFELISKREEAKDAYLTALIGAKTPELTAALTALLPEDRRTAAVVDSAIDAKRRSLIAYRPNHTMQTEQRTAKVVLAELFTGAECGPCQSADRAFDFLADVFPRTEVAILEYHLHIPQPDPMTNPDSWDRYAFYGGNFGTPTAVIDGIQKIAGGGPFYISKNRFDVYDYFIRRSFSRSPFITVTGTAQSSGDMLSVDLQLHSARKEKNFPSYRLHIALVEKSIDYAGSNGITEHSFVVRKLIDGAKGSQLLLTSGRETVTTTIDLRKVELGLKNYLDTVAHHPSWRSSFADFPGFRVRPDTLDRSKLAVVVWVQDSESKAVLQSFVCDVGRHDSVK